MTRGQIHEGPWTVSKRDNTDETKPVALDLFSKQQQQRTNECKGRKKKEKTKRKKSRAQNTTNATMTVT
jgi:hypothetical protein